MEAYILQVLLYFVLLELVLLPRDFLRKAELSDVFALLLSGFVLGNGSLILRGGFDFALSVHSD